MPVSQRFIDLLNVPLGQLRAAAEHEEIAGFASMTKWALAERLADLPRDRLEELGGGFLYAGRTSLSFFRVDEESPSADDDRDAADGVQPDDPGEDAVLEGAELDPDSVEDVLNEMSAGGNGFRGRLLRLTALGYAISFGLALLIGLGLYAAASSSRRYLSASPCPRPRWGS